MIKIWWHQFISTVRYFISGMKIIKFPHVHFQRKYYFDIRINSSDSKVIQERLQFMEKAKIGKSEKIISNKLFHDLNSKIECIEDVKN